MIGINGTEHGVLSEKFWRRPTKEEERAKGIIPKGSNPELFFKFNKNGKNYRMYKSTFLNKNPEALTEMAQIIENNPETWPQVINKKYGIIIDEHLWENNPLLLESSDEATTTLKNTLEKTLGGGVDIHKWIGKLPIPKAGWTPCKYKYMGAYNPLDEQLKYGPKSSKITDWYVQPYSKVDEISARHDVCYDRVSKGESDMTKNQYDDIMVDELDQIPYGEMPKWGSTARFLINTKKKLGLVLQTKNASRR